jgi:hypothetical protein
MLVASRAVSGLEPGLYGIASTQIALVQRRIPLLSRRAVRALVKEFGWS